MRSWGLERRLDYKTSLSSFNFCALTLVCSVNLWIHVLTYGLQPRSSGSYSHVNKRTQLRNSQYKAFESFDYHDYHYLLIMYTEWGPCCIRIYKLDRQGESLNSDTTRPFILYITYYTHVSKFSCSSTILYILSILYLGNISHFRQAKSKDGSMQIRSKIKSVSDSKIFITDSFLWHFLYEFLMSVIILVTV